jgi:glycosyltransferase involved in cell wall biosynthesis
LSPTDLSYALITPARNEAENLRRLVASVIEQTARPSEWVIVDNGSTDETGDVVAAFAAEHPWIRVVRIPGSERALPGAPVVRAFTAGIESLEGGPDVVVKLDADVSFAPDYFQRLVGAFADDPSLGIAGGQCLELVDETWRAEPSTGTHVRGATRAYRRECLSTVLPLAECVGWDGLDEVKAATRGWSSRTVDDLFFRHHRPVGKRDGARHVRWYARGKGAYYMGYRPSFLAARIAYNTVNDPSALAMVAGYLAAAVKREQRCVDPEVRELLRDQQRLRRLHRRGREVLGGSGSHGAAH